MACRLAGTKPLFDQWWNIVNWALRNKLQWNFVWNSNIFIQENALENVVCEMASILSRPQCVKGSQEVGSPLVSYFVRFILSGSFCQVHFLSAVTICTEKKRSSGWKFVITGGTVSCDDNLWCHHWQQSCQIDDLFSMCVPLCLCTMFHAQHARSAGIPWKFF